VTTSTTSHPSVRDRISYRALVHLTIDQNIQEPWDNQSQHGLRLGHFLGRTWWQSGCEPGRQGQANGLTRRPWRKEGTSEGQQGDDAKRNQKNKHNVTDTNTKCPESRGWREIRDKLKEKSEKWCKGEPTLQPSDNAYSKVSVKLSEPNSSINTDRASRIRNNDFSKGVHRKK